MFLSIFKKCNNFCIEKPLREGYDVVFNLCKLESEHEDDEDEKGDLRTRSRLCQSYKIRKNSKTTEKVNFL